MIIMSPRWIVGAISLLVVLMAPDPVSSQVTGVKLLRTAVCVACSGVFVFNDCAPEETVFCRIIAFKISLLCNTSPCINYGAPANRECTAFRGSCAIWNIRPLGLCSPKQVCCARSSNSRGTLGGKLRGNIRSGMSQFKSRRPGGSWRDNNNSKGLIRIRGRGDSGFIPGNKAISDVFEPVKDVKTIARWNDVRVLAQSGSESDGKRKWYIPLRPEEYLENWVKDEKNDSEALEKAIRDHYDQFVLELKAINEQEKKFRKKMIPVPSFEEFHAAVYK